MTQGVLTSHDRKLIAGRGPRTAKDEAMLAAAAGADIGLKEVSAQDLTLIGALAQKRLAQQQEELRDVLRNANYATKLAVAMWIFEAIVDHAVDGGTFRYLIYDRLGFGPDAYAVLHAAGGMMISNEFDLTGDDRPRYVVADLVDEMGIGVWEPEG